MGWSLCQGGNGGGGNKIPFLFSSNYGWLNLPVTGNTANMVIKFKFYLPLCYNEALILGNEWRTSGYLFHTMSSNKVYYYFNDDSATQISAGVPYGIKEVELGSSYIKYDGTTYTGTATTRSSGTIQLYSLGGNHYNPIGFSEIKIYINGNLAYDLVPMEDANNEGYFYDEVNQVSYYAPSGHHLYYRELEEVA